MKTIYKRILFSFLFLFIAKMSFSCGFNLLTPGTIVTVDPTCYGFNNGQIFVYPTGGIAPYTYILANGAPQTSNMFYGLTPSTYWLKVQDATLCMDSIQVTINDPMPISLYATATNATCNNSDGLVCVNVYGGYPPYNLSLGATSVTTAGPNYCFTNLPPDTFYAFATDAMGCPFVIGSSLAIVGKSSSGSIGATISDTVYDETCHYSGDGGIDITATPSAGLTYLWSTGATSQDLYNAVTGNYDVVISSSPNNCIIVTEQVNFIGTNCGTLGGKTMVDSNSNCMFDASDFALPNTLITLSNGDYTFTNNSGDYFFNSVPLGPVNISQTFWIPNYYPNACTQPSVVNVTPTSGLTPEIFKDSTTYACDAQVNTILYQIVPGTNSHAVIHLVSVQNNLNCGGTLSYVLPSPLVYNSATPAPAGVYPTANGDSIVWNFSTMTYTWWGDLFNVYFSSPTTLTLGNSYTGCAHVQLNSTDVNLSNNDDCFARVVTSSFDPNDKSVSPVGVGAIGGITTNDSILTYVVRFQNTGTASATNIVIKDTISSHLNLKSLQVLQSSHSYEIDIVGGNEIQFKFKNINLPDSNANEPLSHGMIVYRIHQKSGNSLGDQIENSASIYFDYNAPVKTNTTLNTITAPQFVNNMIDENELNFYPIPTHDVLTISSKQGFNQTIKVELSNSLGQLVRSVEFAKSNKQAISIPMNGLPKGMYTVKLISINNVISRKIIHD